MTIYTIHGSKAFVILVFLYAIERLPCHLSAIQTDSDCQKMRRQLLKKLMVFLPPLHLTSVRYTNKHTYNAIAFFKNSKIAKH